jgi:hypothetical protein
MLGSDCLDGEAAEALLEVRLIALLVDVKCSFGALASLDE